MPTLFQQNNDRSKLVVQIETGTGVGVNPQDRKFSERSSRLPLSREQAAAHAKPNRLA